MTAKSPMHCIIRPIMRDIATHHFAIGQAVRLKNSKSGDIYHVTATLPPIGNSLQYRVRNDDERYERVATQDSLEPVDLPRSRDDTTLIERTFGHRQGTKTQQPRDQKAGAGKSTT